MRFESIPSPARAGRGSARGPENTPLSVRLGSVTRVAYNLDEWAKAPRKIPIGGRIVRLDGYRRQPHNTIGVLGGRGGKIVLLVVPAHTEPDRAHAIVMAAAETDNASSVDILLS
jgi:Family of unknown function (DUF5994)